MRWTREYFSWNLHFLPTRLFIPKKKHLTCGREAEIKFVATWQLRQQEEDEHERIIRNIIKNVGVVHMGRVREHKVSSSHVSSRKWWVWKCRHQDSKQKTQPGDQRGPTSECARIDIEINSKSKSMPALIQNKTSSSSSWGFPFVPDTHVTVLAKEFGLQLHVVSGICTH